MTDRNALANALMGRSLLDEPPADMRQQIANALMQPSTADIRNTPAQRGSILPLAIYGDGSARPAMPEGLNRLLEIVTLQRLPDASEGDALLLGGAPALGAAPFAPRGAVGSAGGRLGSLPMDEASRLARAREMGFNVDQPLYHGTYSKFDEFELGKPGASAEIGRPGLSDDYVTFADSKRHASSYGDVGKYYVRGRIYEHDALPDLEHAAKSSGYNSAQEYVDAMGSFYQGTGLDDILRQQATAAKKGGYDGVRIKFGDLTGQGFSQRIGGDVYAVFDPRNIRSTQAAFDPTYAGSANLLAANPSTAAINALIAAALQRDENK